MKQSDEGRAFTLVMPLEAPYSDVVKMAQRGLESLLKVSDFEILSITLLEEGELDTPKGKMDGKRYKVVYENNLPN